MSIPRSKSTKPSKRNDVDLNFLPSFTQPSSKFHKKNPSIALKVFRKSFAVITKDFSPDSQMTLQLNQKDFNVFHVRNPVLQTKKTTFYQSKARQQDQLESKLKEIEIVSQSVGINSEVFRVYQEIFEKIIEKSDKNKNLLEKIKKAYENWISILLNNGKEYENQKVLMKEISENLKNEVKDKKILMKRIEKVSNENERLVKEKNDAKIEFEKVFETFEYENDYNLEFLNFEWKSRLALGFKVVVNQTFEKIKKELRLSQHVEKISYQILNEFQKKGYGIDKILKNMEKENILERWNYFNQHHELKAYEKWVDFIMNTSCGNLNLISLEKRGFE